MLGWGGAEMQGMLNWIVSSLSPHPTTTGTSLIDAAPSDEPLPPSSTTVVHPSFEDEKQANWTQDSFDNAKLAIITDHDLTPVHRLRAHAHLHLRRARHDFTIGFGYAVYLDRKAEARAQEAYARRHGYECTREEIAELKRGGSQSRLERLAALERMLGVKQPKTLCQKALLACAREVEMARRAREAKEAAARVAREEAARATRLAQVEAHLNESDERNDMEALEAEINAMERDMDELEYEVDDEMMQLEAAARKDEGYPDDDNEGYPEDTDGLEYFSMRDEEHGATFTTDLEGDEVSDSYCAADDGPYAFGAAPERCRPTFGAAGEVYHPTHSADNDDDEEEEHFMISDAELAAFERALAGAREDGSGADGEWEVV
ncbi:uncharacterized protein SCHCODRAFT_02502199 [Schizophyllum commune H4-8]|uniref:Uncharacterized protein n=1 Tax=Schizophyllum commune (strain H4-8 / FGSC 9210) TaxID=578458 RepID=D8Q5Y5_SCHCM|nr:uncharacterized protein SCHCODRAFT_02502199 [Schizophyllum commune H4-8]KAI5891973.1 hypothetical protein SCHCODRAFT_02502199 [Schizophyllum commune H4-8]